MSQKERCIRPYAHFIMYVYSFICAHLDINVCEFMQAYVHARRSLLMSGRDGGGAKCRGSEGLMANSKKNRSQTNSRGGVPPSPGIAAHDYVCCVCALSMCVCVYQVLSNNN